MSNIIVITETEDYVIIDGMFRSWNNDASDYSDAWWLYLPPDASHSHRREAYDILETKPFRMEWIGLAKILPSVMSTRIIESIEADKARENV